MSEPDLEPVKPEADQSASDSSGGSSFRRSLSSSSSSSASKSDPSPSAPERTPPANSPVPDCFSIAFGMNPQKDRARDYLRANKMSMDDLRAKREERLRGSLPFWRESLANGTLDKMFDHKHDRKCSKLRKLWWFGVPPNLRGEVWSRVLPNNLSITPELFSILTKQAQQTKLSMERSKKAQEKRSLTSSSDSADVKSQSPDGEAGEKESKKDEKAAEIEGDEKPLGKLDTVQLITFDMPRTFTLLQFFDVNGPLYPGLQSVLEAYVVYRPDLGYVQGMSFLASMLLLNMEPPAAFTMLANILNMPCEKAFYSMDVQRIDSYALAVDMLIAEYMPRIGKLFKKYDISSRMFLLEWVMTLYAKALPLDIAAHVWDLIMLEGEIVIFRVAVALVHLFKNEFIYAAFDQCITLLNNIPQEILDESLFESIAAVNFSHKKWDATLKIAMDKVSKNQL